MFHTLVLWQGKKGVHCLQHLIMVRIEPAKDLDIVVGMVAGEHRGTRIKGLYKVFEFDDGAFGTLLLELTSLDLVHETGHGVYPEASDPYEVRFDRIEYLG